MIIETGAIVPGADSYVDVADCRLYATARGVVLPAADGDVETLLIKAADILETYSSRFVGERIGRDQPLSWPRKGAIIEGFTWGEAEIPRQVLNAQLALVVELNAGEDPLNPASSLPVVGETVGPISVQYANPGNAQKVSKKSPSQTIIKLLLKRSGLNVVRS
jgi:hypothetical protein